MTTLHEALAEALDPPKDYSGAITELQGQGWARVFARSRDSDTLAISNYEAVLTHFAENYELDDDYRVENSSHWAVGWVDEILVRALQCNCTSWTDADIWPHPDRESKGVKLFRCHSCETEMGADSVRQIFIDAWDFAEKLKDYPVLDEEDYSKREHEEIIEYIEGAIFRATPEEIRDDDSWEPNAQDIATYLFDVHSVNHIDEIENGWIEEAIVANYQKEKSVTIELTGVNVERIFRDCLAESVVVENAIQIEGIVRTLVLDREKVESHREEIKGFINQLPSQFLLNGGGGWTFLNLCMREDGVQWTGLHLIQEQLYALAAALGMAKIQLPRELWSALPGGVPYIVFDPEEKV